MIIKKKVCPRCYGMGHINSKVTQRENMTRGEICAECDGKGYNEEAAFTRAEAEAILKHIGGKK